ncbi:MAG: D-glycero-beta-D-manno-heptose-7-phosphate kinase [Sphingobacteriales bacterium]|nr:D-glycero-beta-D-manno-heptose-7-phosphate kinase [Sphingobacteriales bacterium]
MIDAYLWGKVDRISPEAPVPIVSVNKKESRLGGAANVALNIKALGANPVICSIIGDDSEADEFLRLLNIEQISSDGIIKVAHRQTTVKTRVIGNNQQILRVDAETDVAIGINETNLVLHKFRLMLAQNPIDAIIFQDYDKGLVTQQLIDEVTKTAKEKHIPIVVDPKKRHFLSYKNVDVFKPNLKELKEGLKIDFNPKNLLDLRAAVVQLQELIAAKNIVVTLSELGIYTFQNNEEHLTPAHIRNVADVSGAGDTVISVIATCIAAKADISLAAQLGNLAGGLVCEKVGVVPIDKTQLLAEAEKI